MSPAEMRAEMARLKAENEVLRRAVRMLEDVAVHDVEARLTAEMDLAEANEAVVELQAMVHRFADPLFEATNRRVA